MTDPFLAAFDALPTGAFSARYENARWDAAKTSLVDGRSWKLVARRAGGGGYVSLNL
ncbi:hypothetical protein OCGS_2055 [Oceaniovalibus guishaninsula JLT2003]|uniref:Uncharacterized protein n=1 Tax=Oceaniovalibus guishaninsula JLT2003 TaxID=1231392 RepID=K2GLY2_9RHOB|nr:hypothetical protein [Oceaniovalibus guishaninsula]EKE43721.1 hypothetical protein OCGS_2055 [Oceaniovalibus guishaninsula JLT2003]